MQDNNKQYDPTEKVERMNRIFDRVVLPIIAFTAVMLVITAVILKPESCAKDFADTMTPVEDNVSTEPDAYLLREVLLEDMDSNYPIFEQGGYTVVETDESGYVAYRFIDEHTEIFENLTGSGDIPCSAVIYNDEVLSVTVRIYSGKIFLVEASSGEKSASAIFRDDRFATWTSGSDADAQAVLELADSRFLSGLVEQYKQSILSLFDE